MCVCINCDDDMHASFVYISHRESPPPFRLRAYKAEFTLPVYASRCKDK